MSFALEVADDTHALGSAHSAICQRIPQPYGSKGHALWAALVM